MRRKGTRGRKRMHLLRNQMKGKYVALKRTAEDRKEWQQLHRAGSQSYKCFSADYLKKKKTVGFCDFVGTCFCDGMVLGRIR